MLGRPSPLIFLSVACASLACQGSPERPEAGAQRPPNVVLILADDLGWGELGSYGQELIRTPHLDQLASEGMRFTQCYAGAPVCAPSRNVLLTGKHLGHVTIRGNKPAQNTAGERVEGQHPIPASALTIAEVFREAGYATGAMGKWGLGPVGSSGAPNAQGFDRFFGYNCQRVAHSYYPPHLWRDELKIELNAEPIGAYARQPEGQVELQPWLGENYAPAQILDEALSFIHEHRDEPFFLYLPFVEPHVAMQPPIELVESYPESWDPEPYRGQFGYLPHPRPRAGYAAMITDLDRHVGAVLKTLEELGLAENTLVIFTSDNGTTHGGSSASNLGVGGVDSGFFNSTAGLRGFKGSVYEGGLRVPLIVRWPGRVAAGSSSQQPTYFPDWFPTLCAAMDFEVPAGLDGISILPTLTGEGQQAARNPMVWVFPEYGGQVAVRFDDWKLVRRDLLRKNQLAGPWELYHIPRDPAEASNLAAEHPELVAQGEAILRQETAENPLFPVPLPK